MLKSPVLTKQTNESIAKNFFNNISSRLDDIKKSNVHPFLKGIITKESLIAIYSLLMTKRDVFEQSLSVPQREKFAYRISRKDVNYSFRTVEVVEDLNGELVLVLQTKHKLANGEKDRNIPISEGTIKRVKSSWRIDTAIPEPWVAAVVTGNYVQLALTDYKSALSFAERPAINEELGNPVLPWLKGEEYVHKQAPAITLFAPKAFCTLKTLIVDHWHNLSEQDIRNLALGLLNAVYFLRSYDSVHQDLYMENVLVFKENNQYFIRIIDFEFCTIAGSGTAVGPIGYESPEIRLTYHSEGRYHKSFQKHNDSYGHYVYQELEREEYWKNDKSAKVQEYRTSNLSNDIWALGIMLNELRTGRSISRSKPKHFEQCDSLLIKGLLKKKRDERLTIEEAICMFHNLNAPFKKTFPESTVKPLCDALFTKISDNLHELKNNGDKDYSLRLTKGRLIQIYEYILANSSDIVAKLSLCGPDSINKMSCKIVKSEKLPFAIEIIHDKNLGLIIIANTPGLNQFVSYNGFLRLKYCRECVRIDSLPCQRWWRSTGVGSYFVKRLHYEAVTSQKLVKELRKTRPTSDIPFSEIRIGCKTLTKQNRSKLSVYSPMAEFTLYDENRTIHFTSEDKREIERGIILAVEVTHGLNLTVNCISARNFLVFKGEKGFCVRMTGFHQVLMIGASNPLALIGYESPEICFTHKGNSEHFEYYHQSNYSTYGLICYKKMQFDGKNVGLTLAHPSNDMWALGMVFCLLIHGINPYVISLRVEQIIDPLIKGLLNPKREERWDIARLKQELGFGDERCDAGLAAELESVNAPASNPILPLFRIKQATEQELEQQIVNLQALSLDEGLMQRAVP